MVQQERDSVVTLNSVESGFKASSLASHVVEHCRDCLNEEETVQWCVDNIKVKQIQRARSKDKRVKYKKYNGEEKWKRRWTMNKVQSKKTDRERSVSVQKLRALSERMEKSSF